MQRLLQQSASSAVHGVPAPVAEYIVPVSAVSVAPVPTQRQLLRRSAFRYAFLVCGASTSRGRGASNDGVVHRNYGTRFCDTDDEASGENSQ